jgi:hypothetical protein
VGDRETIIRDRRDFVELLSAAMSSAWSELRENQRLLFGQNLLKTYVIEMDAEAQANWPVSFEGGGLRLVSEVDADLAVLAGVRETYVIVDRIHRRFALLHSLAAVSKSDAAVDSVVGQKSFDRIWLAVSQLEEIASMGALRGFTTRFDRSEITRYSERYAPQEAADGQFEDVHTDPELPVESLRLRLWGSEAPRVLDLLRHQEPLARATSVASVRLRYFAQDPGLGVLDEIDYTGRVTSRGNSYELHRHFVQRIVDGYSERVDALERARIDLTHNGLLGEPFVVPLDGITPPMVIAQALSDGTYPFRFVGVPRWLDDDYVVLPALDLHGGHYVDFEIAPELVRIYLRAGACGNSLMRLQANMQHHVDARFALPV